MLMLILVRRKLIPNSWYQYDTNVLNRYIIFVLILIVGDMAITGFDTPDPEVARTPICGSSG